MTQTLVVENFKRVVGTHNSGIKGKLIFGLLKSYFSHRKGVFVYLRPNNHHVKSRHIRRGAIR